MVYYTSILIEPATALIEPVKDLIEPVKESEGGSIRALVNRFPPSLKKKVDAIGERTSDKSAVEQLILDLCAVQALSVKQLSGLLGRGNKYLLYNFVKPLREKGRLEYTIPDMPNHPNQAYRTVQNEV